MSLSILRKINEEYDRYQFQGYVPSGKAAKDAAAVSVDARRQRGGRGRARRGGFGSGAQSVIVA